MAKTTHGRGKRQMQQPMLERRATPPGGCQRPRRQNSICRVWARAQHGALEVNPHAINATAGGAISHGA
eukprot:7677126-Lingulodinium_polyedra.AAC.1